MTTADSAILKAEKPENEQALRLKLMKIMFDVDGVLADFMLSFTTRASERYGTPVFSTLSQPSWRFDYMLTPRQVEMVLSGIHAEADFWEGLAPLFTIEELHKLCNLQDKVDLIFVTNRVSTSRTSAQLQTQKWLKLYGIDYPVTLCSKHKAEIARIIRPDFAIEDKWENAQCIAWFSEETKVYLLNRPYNFAPERLGSQRVKRINRLEEFLAAIEEAL